MRSIALANQKGGVGKTTTAVHLAHGLALRGQRVALFDLDPQGNATVALQGMTQHAAGEGAFRELHGLSERLWLLPSPGATGSVSRFAVVDVGRLSGLAASLAEAGLDTLIVDCPPRMDEWGWAGLQLCGEVLVPVQAEFFAMHGLSQMLGTLERAAAEFPGRARLFGILPTLVDPREAVTIEVLQDLRRTLGAQVLKTVVLRDANFVEAASHGQTVFDYNPRAVGALCYGELVREVVHG